MYEAGANRYLDLMVLEHEDNKITRQDLLALREMIQDG